MGYFKPNTKMAIKVALAIKGLTASMVTMAYVNNKPNYMFIIMMIGAAANELINILSDATQPTDKSTK